MDLIQDEDLGRFWKCPWCMVEVAEDFSKPEIPMDRIQKGE